MNIKGRKVLLRPIDYSDTDLIVKWRNNPKVRDKFVFRDIFTEEMHVNWMNDRVKKGEVVQYIIIENISNIPIGSVYYRDINYNNNSAEFGIFIGEDHARGKGYGSEATRLFVEYGFKQLKLHRIYLRVFEKNIQAIRSYKNAGFMVEGVFRDMVCIDGEYFNMMFMAILNNK